jgi:hypothetical protein
MRTLILEKFAKSEAVLPPPVEGIPKLRTLNIVDVQPETLFS